MNLILFSLINLTLMTNSLTPASIEKKNNRAECDLLALKSIKGDKGQVIGTYCRCNDGSYGLSCEQRHPNPCIGNVRFEILPNSIPNNYFIHCDNNMPYLFKCPMATIWDNSLMTCSSFNVDPSEYIKLFQNYVQKKTGELKVDSQKWIDMRKSNLLDENLTKMFEDELNQTFFKTDFNSKLKSQSLKNKDHVMKMIDLIKYKDLESYSLNQLEYLLNYLNHKEEKEETFNKDFLLISSVPEKGNKIESNLLPKHFSKAGSDKSIKKHKIESPPSVYEIQMPRSLTKTNFLETFDMIVQRLGDFSSSGIDILLKFPHV